MGHFFDIHPSFRAVHDHILPLRPVQQHRQIKFLYRIGAGIIDVLGNKYLVHLLSRRTGLNSDQGPPEKSRGDLPDVFGALPHCYSLLLRPLDLSLTTAAGMYLGLYDGKLIAILNSKVFIGFFCRIRVVYRDAFLYGYIIFLQ